MKSFIFTSVLLISGFAQASYTAILCTAMEIPAGGNAETEPFWTQEFKTHQTGKIAVSESFEVKGKPYHVSTEADGVLISLTTVTGKGEPVRGTGFGLIGVETMHTNGSVLAVVCVDQRQ